MNIQPIVEGHGEVAAVPVLLRRFVHDAQAWRVGVGRPIRRSRSQLVQQAQLEQAVGLALRQPGCDAVLIMFDGDDDCPAELGPMVHQWASAAARSVPCEVVLPHREYEAWFLAAIESLRGARGVRYDAPLYPDPETPRGAAPRRNWMQECKLARATWRERISQRSARGSPWLPPMLAAGPFES